METTTLDTVLAGREIALIKIDVEGFECQVLAGAKRTLETTQSLIIEAQNAEQIAKVTNAVGPGWQRLILGPSDLPVLSRLMVTQPYARCTARWRVCPAFGVRWQPAPP